MVHILALYLAAVILHESAHAIVGEILGVPVKGIRFSWGSIGLLRASGRPLANLLISCAGPLDQPLSMHGALALLSDLRTY
jgi:hypothetical protein